MKLNLGCGNTPLQGYVNIDRWGKPDWEWDLEFLPWPFVDNDADEIRAHHILEHLHGFVDIMVEMYRVCRHGALIDILVPHPAHDNFVTDPTHVQAISERTFALFDKQNCIEWQAAGSATTPLALMHDVDFKTLTVEGRINGEVRALPEFMFRHGRNIYEEIHFMLEVRK